MLDLREEIPKRAFLNAEISQMMVETSSFTECVDAVRQKYGLQEYQFMNQAYVISLLYCLLVVPREIWLKSASDHAIYEEVEKKDPLQYFSLEIPSSSDDPFFRAPIRSLIRRLRNSVAHARFSVDRDLTFTFWDQKGEDAPQNFRASISATDLMTFISQVGSLLANIG